MSNLDFDQAVETFMVYFKAKGLAKRTLDTYSFALADLRRFLAREAVSPHIPTCYQLRDYVATMLVSHATPLFGRRYANSASRF